MKRAVKTVTTSFWWKEAKQLCQTSKRLLLRLAWSEAPLKPTTKAALWPHRTYDLLWREAMVELVDALEVEDPEQSTSPPQVRRELLAAGGRNASSHNSAGLPVRGQKHVP